MKIALVDGYSTGRLLAEAVRRRGLPAVHVRSSDRMSAYFTRGFDPSHYEQCLTADGGPAALVPRLSGLGVTRVLAGTESGVELADALTHLMGLPGHRFAQVAARRDKTAMARTVAEAGLAVPLGAAFADPAAAGAWYAQHGLSGAVVKPPRSAGSDNVWFCADRHQVEAACAHVLTADNVYGEHNGSVLVQERLTGTEYYANTVSHDGVHKVAELWRYTKRGAASGRPVYDFEQPVPAGCLQGDAVRRFVPLVLDALGIVTGAAHTEVMVTGRGPVLIESGARLGGGTLPWVVEKFCGVSQTGLLADALVDPAAVGRFDEREVHCTADLRNVALINHEQATVASVRWEERLRKLPTLVAVSHAVRPGAVLPVTADLLTSPGFVYLAGAPAEVDRDYRTLRAWEEHGLYTG